jgi:serine-type D-Ala-D-Ala carboxypeptidase (penicillin-binding protein 5/6)
MAALVVLEKADLDEEVTVSEDAAYARPAYSNVGLLPGDTLSIRELVMTTLISSSDDAAYALVEYVGGEAGVNRFIEEMNEGARASGLKYTHFENPVGFDARGHYSSARDLARMARLALQDPEFRKIVSTEYATIYTPYREIPLVNTNELVFSYGPATGGRAVRMRCPRRRRRPLRGLSRTLRYGFDAHDRKDLVVEGKRYANVDVPYRRQKSVVLVVQSRGG